MRFLFGPDGPLRDAASGDGGDAGGGGEQPLTPEQAKVLQDEVTRLKRENGELTTRATESEQTARYWNQEAKKAGGGGRAKETPKEDALEEEEDVIEALSKGGSKAFRTLAKKAGLVDEATVETRIESRAQQLVAEAALTKDYPELNDKTSEFFKQTAAIYNELLGEGVPKNSAMRQAARLAELDGIKSGKRLTPEMKEEREARARAAGGDGGKKRPKEGEESDELDPWQARICEGMDVDPEDYKKTAKAGVRVRK